MRKAAGLLKRLAELARFLHDGDPDSARELSWLLARAAGDPDVDLALKVIARAA